MSPETKGPVPGLTSRLRRVSLNPAHYRSGRWLLLAEGVLVAALGTAGIIVSAGQPGAGGASAEVLGLALTPAHSVFLVGFGALAMLFSLRRRAAVVLTVTATIGFLALLLIGGVATGDAASGPFGFDPHDIVLNGVLVGINLALLIWLVPDLLEGPAWVRRRRQQTSEPCLREDRR